MGIRIIGDSSCDTTPELRERLGDIVFAPLIVRLCDGREFVDEIGIDTAMLVAEMKALKGATRSSCPPVDTYAEAMRGADESIVITLSSALSGSYSAAVAARELVLEQFPEKKIHVLDSRSASVGETLLALKVREFEALGLGFEEVCDSCERAVAALNTVFVLEDLGNFIKNGRISRLKGEVAHLLNLYPILYGNRQGEIETIGKVRGLTRAHERMIAYICEQTDGMPEKSILLALSYCECPERGKNILKAITSQCRAVREAILVPMGGLSSMYANKGGVIVAF